MHKHLIVAALLAALAVPAGAAAKPNKADHQNASRQCRAERGSESATREAFADAHGTNANKSNAFGKCVSAKTREEHHERHAAARSAAKACRAERKEIGIQAFADKYGTNHNKRNAFGKCVSKAAKKAKRELDAEDRAARVARRNAAKVCDEERGTSQDSRDAFALKYGTNANHKNAFGKCVSQQAKA